VVHYKKMFDLPFKNAVIWFALMAIVCQCILHFSVFWDSLQSFNVCFFGETNMALKTLKLCYYFSFVFFYVMYWFLLTSLLIMPALLLGNYYALRPWLLLYLWLVFTLLTSFSLLDFFVFKHYQFHIGQGMLDWFINLNQAGRLNLQILKDFSISGEEISYFLWILGLILFAYASLIILSVFLVIRYPFKSYLYQYCWSVALFSLSFGFYLHQINGNEPWLISQVNQYPLLKLAFKQGEKWKIFKQFGDDRTVLIVHSVNRTLKQPKPMMANLPKPMNVLWIVVDTLRYDMVNSRDMPFLSDYQQQNLSFMNHWSSGNSTQAGVFGMLYSLPVNYFSSTIKYHTPPFLFEMFENNGYMLNTFYSGNIQLPPFTQNAFSKFSKQQVHIADEKHQDNADEFNVAQLKRFLQTTRQKAFFSFVLLDSVHNYCAPQNYPLVYQDAAKQCQRWKLAKDYDPMPMKKRYLNAVHYTDAKLKEIIDTLKQQGLDKNTLIIITSDHGESFNDYHTDVWGHATGYTKEQIKVPLIIHWPGKQAQTIEYQTTHYDIPVTLLHELLAYEHPTDDYLFGKSLFRPHPSSFLMVGSYIFMAVVFPNKYYVLSSDGAILSYNQFAQQLTSDKMRTEDYSSAIKIMSKYYLY
jgi:arylsulfatase A-like enzyme